MGLEPVPGPLPPDDGNDGDNEDDDYDDDGALMTDSDEDDNADKLRATLCTAKYRAKPIPHLAHNSVTAHAQNPNT